MKPYLLFALFVFPLQAQNSSIIEGSVVDSVTGAGLSDVSVYFGSEQGPHYDGVTDSAGNFQINGVKDGQYGSHFEKAGYIPQFSGSDSTLKPVRIAAGQEAVRLRIALVAYGSLRGRVLDPEGKPVPKATVTLGQQTDAADDQGQFVFTKLRPGSYTLQASPEVSSSREIQIRGEERTEVVPTWFPSVIESSQAEPIVVRGGANLSGYEIRLRTTPVYRVRGVVLAENGKAEPRAVVYDTSASERLVSVGFFKLASSIWGVL